MAVAALRRPVPALAGTQCGTAGGHAAGRRLRLVQRLGRAGSAHGTHARQRGAAAPGGKTLALADGMAAGLYCCRSRRPLGPAPSRLLAKLRSRRRPLRLQPWNNTNNSPKRGGNEIHCRAAPRWISPLGGQRSTRSGKRGGHNPKPGANGIHRRAAPRWISPPGGQRSTRSGKRGGNTPPAATRSQSYAPALRRRPSQSAP